MCGLVLAGQVGGAFLSVPLYFLPLGLTAESVPFLDSADVAIVLILIGAVSFPVAGAWWLVRGLSPYPRPLLVSTSSFLMASAVFASMLSTTGGDRRAVGAVATPILVLLPIASVAGSYLSQLIPTSRRASPTAA